MMLPIRGSMARWWLRADATRPGDWAARRAGGYAPFLFRYGVLPLGFPAAILLDLALLARRHDLPLFLSAEHALQLELVVLIVGIPAGLLAGRVLWRVGERRAAEEQLTRAFDIVPEVAERRVGAGD
jgi:hypothetical protein